MSIPCRTHRYPTGRDLPGRGNVWIAGTRGGLLGQELTTSGLPLGGERDSSQIQNERISESSLLQISSEEVLVVLRKGRRPTLNRYALKLKSNIGIGPAEAERPVVVRDSGGRAPVSNEGQTGLSASSRRRRDHHYRAERQLNLPAFCSPSGGLWQWLANLRRGLRITTVSLLAQEPRGGRRVAPGEGSPPPPPERPCG
jgi:hypothetical protein